MKRIILILLIVMGTVAIGIRVLGASAGRALLGMSSVRTSPFQVSSARSLQSMRFLSAPIVDGDLSDWLAGDRINLDRYTAFSYSGNIDSPADLSAIIRSAWDEQTLYFAIEVNDDVRVTDGPDLWRDDGVEVALDGLNDKNAWGEDDHQYSIVADGSTFDRSVPITSIVASVLTYEGGYSIEVAIPMAELIPGVPISGTVMGFTVGLRDDDDGGDWDAYLIWEGTNTSGAPEEFGSLVFTERLEDRIDALEARIIQLEQKLDELLQILSEFEGLPPP